MPPGNPLIKPVSAVYKPPKPQPNAFANLGIEGSGYATAHPQVGVSVPAAPAAPKPPAAPAPINWDDVTHNAEYNRGDITLNESHRLAMLDILNNFAQRKQSSQDSFNAHGGLFSGANVNANQNISNDQVNANAAEVNRNLAAHDTLHQNVFNHLTSLLTTPTA